MTEICPTPNLNVELIMIIGLAVGGFGTEWTFLDLYMGVGDAKGVVVMMSADAAADADADAVMRAVVGDLVGCDVEGLIVA